MEVGAATDEEVFIIIVEAANGAIIDDEDVLPTPFPPYWYCEDRWWYWADDGGVLHALCPIGISSIESHVILSPPLLKLFELKGSYKVILLYIYILQVHNNWKSFLLLVLISIHIQQIIIDVGNKV